MTLGAGINGLFKPPSAPVSPNNPKKLPQSFQSCLLLLLFSVSPHPLPSVSDQSTRLSRLLFDDPDLPFPARCTSLQTCRSVAERCPATKHVSSFPESASRLSAAMSARKHHRGRTKWAPEPGRSSFGHLKPFPQVRTGHSTPIQAVLGVVMERRCGITIGEIDLERLNLESAPPGDSSHASGVEDRLGPGQWPTRFERQTHPDGAVRRPVVEVGPAISTSLLIEPDHLFMWQVVFDPASRHILRLHLAATEQPEPSLIQCHDQVLGSGTSASADSAGEG